MKRPKNVYIIIVWKNSNLHKKDREFPRGPRQAKNVNLRKSWTFCHCYPERLSNISIRLWKLKHTSRALFPTICSSALFSWIPSGVKVKISSTLLAVGRCSLLKVMQHSIAATMFLQVVLWNGWYSGTVDGSCFLLIMHLTWRIWFPEEFLLFGTRKCTLTKGLD